MFDFIKDLQDDEVVKPVQGCDWRYFITNRGRLYSVPKRRWLKGSPYRYYDLVSLKFDDNQYHGTNIHYLVGKHFLPGWKPELEVCHHNEKLPREIRNDVNNLWLGTRKQNYEDAVEKGRMPGNNQCTPESVKALRDQGMSYQQIGDYFGVSYSTARRMYSDGVVLRQGVLHQRRQMSNYRNDICVADIAKELGISTVAVYQFLAKHSISDLMERLDKR